MQRLVLWVGLAALLVGMFVHYGAVADAHDPSPTVVELRTDYASHVGDQLYAWATVLEHEGDRATVQIGTLPEAVTLTVPTTRSDIEAGDVIQLSGTIRPGHTVTPDRIVVSDRTGLTRLYLLSAIAAIGTTAHFFRTWRFDRSRVVFAPRDGDRSDA